eukprot:GEZU01006026.1.p1 GENE.GEZU01006026.1~~GEZU01006026.1.p1  ORF type:complete len:194 (-),score=79.64 GEZU01006026.1:693-1274(-)
MGISQAGHHKRRKTGAKQYTNRKSRKFELGRQAANTKIGARRVRPVRVRGGSYKYKALRLDTGNFSWATESCTRKTRILNVVYNASNNELVRTNTLVKNAIVHIDATPFRQWYEQTYGITLTGKKITPAAPAATDATKKAAKPLEANLIEQFASGRVLAAISTRPGQQGTADGYILEGEELAFYMKKIQKKKK